jgi:cell division protein FtsZ
MTSSFTDSIESAAKAAVAAAVSPPTAVEDVMIRPIPPKPSLFPEPSREPMPQEPAARTFIPPQPERAIRAPRMPRIEDLPIPGQNQLRAKRGIVSDADHPEKRRMTLMQRLASVGLGRKEEPGEFPAEARPVARQTPPGFDRMPQRSAPRSHDSRAQEPVSEYARKAAPQGLDPLGRQTAVHNSPEEDQLDIPAFLRRQVN